MARTWRNSKKTRQRRFKSKENEAKVIQNQIREDLLIDPDESFDDNTKESFDFGCYDRVEKENIAKELIKYRKDGAKKILDDKLLECYLEHCWFGLGDLSHAEFTRQIVNFLELLLQDYIYF